MLDEVKRLVLFSSGLVELSRNRAESLARDLLRATGGAAGGGRGQISALARELSERSRQNRAEVLAIVRSEIQVQLNAVGVATRRDLERLERRVERLEDERSEEPAAGVRARSSEAARKTTGGTARKITGSTARKTVAKSSRKTTTKSTRRRPVEGL
ncbi:MAG TPA: hypothetical protein VE975_00895 [Actinomycetota bacterium]|jgi:polyhydroxyalkanoate synthesis regulator phasin|nr:hypothetical protein [Actinomycetota bacterium]